jgi:small subunit ribosomal protein S4
MGDPKFLRRGYDTPKHPWEAQRMEEERKLLQKYGLKNKRELWRSQSVLRGFRRQARDLQARLRTGEPQAKREADGLLGRLTRLGILPVGTPTIDDVLALTPEVVLQRRLEWIVFARGLAGTAKQARQMIVHGHVALDGRRLTRPGYLVAGSEEAKLAYAPTSAVAEESHPIRVAMQEKQQARSESPPPPVEPATEGR